MKENVFIAWGGNKPLADAVGQSVEKLNCHALIGGGTPKSLFIGHQVVEQIKRCTQAIILVQERNSATDFAKDVISANLMFEWGYIIATLPPDRVHVFVIDMDQKDLPSDLAGSWAKKVISTDKTLQETANEIALQFYADHSALIVENKITIMHDWKNIKYLLSMHAKNPTCTDDELAHFLLHSFHSAYYYNELNILTSLAESLDTQSENLAAVAKFIQHSVLLFEATINLSIPLELHYLNDLESYFLSDFETVDDADLRRWLYIYASHKLSLCYNFAAIHPSLDKEDTFYFRAMSEKKFSPQLIFSPKLLMIIQKMMPMQTYCTLLITEIWLYYIKIWVRMSLQKKI